MDQAEGHLTSLDLARGRSSGFRVHARLDEAAGQFKARIFASGDTSIRQPWFRFSPIVADDRKTIDYLPYVAEDEQLRFWDLEESRDLEFKHFGNMKRGFEADYVRKHLPRVSALAQSEGFWKSL